MKRITGLYEKIISIENLTEADRMARKGKAKSYGVKLHDQNREQNILLLHQLLKSGNFKTSEYSVFKIRDPKERLIYRLPYYPDRIIHWAIMLQLEPVWMSVFTRDTYSCIKGRGIHGTAKQLHKCLASDQRGTQYCLKIDIHKFYPSINHVILKRLIRRKIKDYRLLSLLDEIIDSAPGLPIGNYLSQFFANLYLAYFDHWIKEIKKVMYYFRYCDDMIFLSESKPVLHSLFSDINNYLNNQLDLVVKSNYQIFPVDKRGIDFVGYVFFHDHVMLRKSIKKNMMKKISLLNKRNITGIRRKIEIASYWGWIHQPYVSSKNLKRKVVA